MIVSQYIRQFGVLMAVGILALPVTCTNAQEIPDSKRSVVVFDFKLDRIFESAKTLGADLKQLDASLPMEDIFEGVKPTELKRVYGSVSLPEKVEQLMALGMVPGLPLEFFVRFEFANADACRMMTENIEDRSTEVELEGKTFWTPDGQNMGVFGRRVDDTTFEFGSKAYVVEAKRNFLTSSLNRLWKTVPDEAIRIAVDLETPASFIAEAVAMGSESGDPQVTAYLELIDNLETVAVSADMLSTNLLTFVATAKDAEQAEEVKSGLDSLLMMAQMGGKMAVGQLAKDSPEAATVVKGVLDSLNATQEDSVVKISVPKPEGFAEAVTQLVNQTKTAADAASTMNNFRQVGLSMHNYHAVYNKFPFDVSDREDLNNELSWRVRVLPYLDQNAMYEQMDVAAGPSTDANANFAEKMPSIFGADGKLANVVWIKSNAKSFREITDGTSNTIVLIELTKGEPWLKNGGLSIDEAVALVTGLADGEELIAMLYDGSSRRLTNKINKETLQNLFNPADGNVIQDF